MAADCGLVAIDSRAPVGNKRPCREDCLCAVFLENDEAHVVVWEGNPPYDGGVERSRTAAVAYEFPKRNLAADVGPRGNENYTKKVPTMSKRVAVKQALTLANEAGKIVVDEIKTTGKTKDVVNYLAEKKFDRRVLIVVDEKTNELIRATANIQNVLLIRSTYLSVYHILNADKIVIAPKSIETIKNWLVKEEA